MYWGMVSKTALTSFVCCLIIGLKEVAVGNLKWIPERSRLNLRLSWLLIAPLSFVAIFCSISVFLKYLSVKKNSIPFWKGNLLLSIPGLALFFYTLLLVILLIRETFL